MRFFKLNPITRKRLARFKELKRSYYSFWLLVGLYMFGMLADVLFNEKPLYVRYEGKSYFPILFYYPDNEFTGSGLDSRPNYKEIARSLAFQEDSHNFMVFTPYPYGANEGITANQIEVDETVTARIERQQIVGTVELTEDLMIRRSVAGSAFFAAESDRALRGVLFAETVRISDSFRQAIAARFENTEGMPEIEERIQLGDDLSATISLSPYKPRSRPPRSVRVTLREDVSAFTAESIKISPSGIAETSGTLWKNLSDEDRARVFMKAKERMVTRIQPINIDISGENYQIEFEKEDIFFPFRPTRNHWMGLDSSGRDVFSRLIHALRISMNFGILLVVASMVLGITAGALQGYLGGKFDLMGQRAIEIWEALPFLYVMILLGSVFGQSFLLLLVVYALFSWI